jgi:hypothetical protein
MKQIITDKCKVMPNGDVLLAWLEAGSTAYERGFRWEIQRSNYRVQSVKSYVDADTAMALAEDAYSKFKSITL